MLVHTLRDERPCVVYELINASSRHLREVGNGGFDCLGGVANANTHFLRRTERKSSHEKRIFKVHLAATFQPITI